VVTGGGSGLGKATSDHFAQLGYHVVAVDLKVDALVAEGNKLIEGIVADVTSEKDITALAEHIKQKHGRVDVLVNCAGIACRVATFDFTSNTPHSLDLFNKIIQVNVVGTFNLIRLIVPIMAKNEPDVDGQRGVIINVSSVLGLDGTSGFAAYSASKSAVAGISLPLAREFGPIGIRVNAIAPGFCDTPMITNVPEAAKNLYQAKMKELSVFPKRMIRPQEFALMVQSVVDNHALNAELIRLDGGARIY